MRRVDYHTPKGYEYDRNTFDENGLRTRVEFNGSFQTLVDLNGVVRLVSFLGGAGSDAKGLFVGRISRDSDYGNPSVSSAGTLGWVCSYDHGVQYPSRDTVDRAAREIRELHFLHVTNPPRRNVVDGPQAPEQLYNYSDTDRAVAPGAPLSALVGGAALNATAAKPRTIHISLWT